MIPHVNTTSPHTLVLIQHTNVSRRVCLFSSNAAVIFCLALLTVSVTTCLTAVANESAQSSKPAHPKEANFKQEHASYEVRYLAAWAIDSGDNNNKVFVIVDKANAKVFVFNADGRLKGAAPALLGLAKGDDSVPGIGNRKIASIRREERTTPAGRFVASLDQNLRGEEILWVDYDTGISMHQVKTNKFKKNRLKRLATSTPLDNRITYGCINISEQFFVTVVRPAFTGTNGIVYVLPESGSARTIFGAYDVEERALLQNLDLTKESSKTLKGGI